MNQTKLTDEQSAKLRECADHMLPCAAPASNDATTMQCVATLFGYHWLFLYWRTIEQLADDTWSVHISRIHHMGIEMVTEDSPYCTNYTPYIVKFNDGTEQLFSDFVGSEDDIDE